MAGRVPRRPLFWGVGGLWGWFVWFGWWLVGGACCPRGVAGGGVGAAGRVWLAGVCGWWAAGCLCWGRGFGGWVCGWWVCGWWVSFFGLVRDGGADGAPHPFSCARDLAWRMRDWGKTPPSSAGPRAPPSSAAGGSRGETSVRPPPPRCARDLPRSACDGSSTTGEEAGRVFDSLPVVSGGSVHLECFLECVEEGIAVGLGVLGAEVELGAHGVEEDAALDEGEQDAACLLAVAGSC